MWEAACKRVGEAASPDLCALLEQHFKALPEEESQPEALSAAEGVAILARDAEEQAAADQAAEAERSGAKHEATMLLQQARFFGQRMDSKIAQRHADGEKAKQERAEEHQRFKASERAAYDERVDAAVRAGAVLFPKRSW